MNSLICEESNLLLIHLRKSGAMGELVRRLDYERRSKTLMRGEFEQRINKEYSTPVRSANAMVERQRDLQIKRAQLHLRNFLSRSDYEIKMVKRFHRNLDYKSQKFDESKFEQARGRSARARLETVSHHDLTSEARDKVTSLTRLNTELNSAHSRANYISDSDSDSESVALPTIDVRGINALRRGSRSNRIQRPSSSTSSTSLSDTFETRAIGAKNIRCKAVPQRARSAYIPRDRRPCSARPSSASNKATLEVSTEEMCPTTRSYRLLREAFKKTREESPNRQKEQLEFDRRRSRKHYEVLLERTLKKFNDIFEGKMKNIY